VAEGADFLYPFLGEDRADPTALLEDLTASAITKAAASAALQAATLAAIADDLAATAAAMAARFERGGRLLTFGNGGSATDAAGLAALFALPPNGPAHPARCLAEDPAVLTALANDVGHELVFARQLIAHASSADIAFGISTSGGSTNLLVAFDEAARRGLLTIALVGYGGGELARSPAVQHRLVVDADSTHRVQEVQAGIGFALWAAVQERVRTSGTLPA
jgi:D-sedoheptulose 7-phosphate isomerase